jgi:hypothetical protein
VNLGDRETTFSLFSFILYEKALPELKNKGHAQYIDLLTEVLKSNFPDVFIEVAKKYYENDQVKFTHFFNELNLLIASETIHKPLSLTIVENIEQWRKETHKWDLIMENLQKKGHRSAYLGLLKELLTTSYIDAFVKVTEQFYGEDQTSFIAFTTDLRDEVTKN